MPNSLDQAPSKSSSETFGITIGDPHTPERNLCGHPLAGLLWERRLEKGLVARRLGKRTQFGMSFCVHRQTLLIRTRRTTEMAGKNQLCPYVVKIEEKY